MQTKGNVILLVILVIEYICICSNSSYMFLKKNDYAQFRFAKIINKENLIIEQKEKNDTQKKWWHEIAKLGVEINRIEREKYF